MCMVSAKKFIQTLNMMGSMKNYILQTYQETLYLSDKLQDCEEKSPNKPPFAINYLEYYDSREPVTSWIIRHMFAYTYNNKHPFFVSFAKHFLIDIGFNIDWIESPIINKDHEYKGIDILVRDNQYAIIIENKLKGADFQLNQLARYIAAMRLEGYSDNQIFVIVLPKYDISNDDLWNSVWNLPKDWQSTSLARTCRVDSNTCWCDYDNFTPKKCCEKCEPLRTKFEGQTLFIHKDLSDWLFDSIINNSLGISNEEIRKQYVLVSAVLQFVDYLNSLYETRENDKFKMDIQKFLSEQLKLNDNIDIVKQISLIENKQNEVLELNTQLETLYQRKVKEFISDRGKKYNVHIVLEENQDYYFHCEFIIDTKTIIVSVNYEKNFYCQIETKSQRRLPDCIINDFEITEELNDKDNRSNCIWRYDEYLESLLRFDRILSRLLEIKG